MQIKNILITRLTQQLFINFGKGKEMKASLAFLTFFEEN